MAASAGYPCLVKVATTSSGSYTAVGYASDMAFGASFDELDVSGFSATVTSQQLKLGLSKGKSSIKCTYDSADTSGQNVIRSNFLTRTALYFQFLTAPAASAGSQGYKIKAFVSSLDAGATVNGLPTFSVSLAHSGAPVVDNGDADAA